MAIYLQGVGANSFLLSYAGVDLTNHVRSVTINQEYEQVESTAFGATNRAFLVGLPDASVDVEFYQDFANASVDQTLSPYLGSSTGATLVIQTSGSTVSATNPKYTMVAAIFNYSPVAGSVGEVSINNVTFKPISGGTLTRGTS